MQQPGLLFQYSRVVIVILAICAALLPSGTHAAQTGRVNGTGGDGVWLKAAPNLAAARVTLLPEGTPLQLLQAPAIAGDQLSWAKIAAVGQEGWIVSEYLLLDSAPAPTPATPTGLAPGAWAKVINTYSTTGLRLRTAPAPWENLIAILPEGSLVRIVSGPVAGGNGNQWYEITADGKQGFSDGTYLEPTAAPATTPVSQPPTPAPSNAPTPSNAPAPQGGGLGAGAWAEVNGTGGTTGLRLRAAPAPAEKLLAILPEGTKVQILEGPTKGGNGDPWYRLAWDGSWGWSSGIYLIPASAPTGGQPATPSGGNARGEALAAAARAEVGKPYVWGATGPDSFDCSGLIVHVARKALGISMPRTAAEQASSGVRVDLANLVPGDLVFYENTYGPGITHVGVYIGNKLWVTASNETTGVVIDSLDTPYWKSRYVGARRIT